MVGGMMMNDEIEQIEAVTDDDTAQQNEFDAILSEAIDVDGGQVDESGEVVTVTDESEQIQTSELLYPIVSSTFDIFAPQWKVKDKEKKALAEAYGALLDKYFPNAGELFGPELMALTVTGMVVAPRMLARPEKEVNPKEKPKQKNNVKPEYSFTDGFSGDTEVIQLD